MNYGNAFGALYTKQRSSRIDAGVQSLGMNDFKFGFILAVVGIFLTGMVFYGGHEA